MQQQTKTPAATLNIERGYEDSSGLTEKEIAIRKRWVEEYLKDFDSKKACLRIGYAWSACGRMAELFEADSWTQRYLQEQKTAQAADQFEKDKQLIIQTLRQCVAHGPYPSRIAAAKELAKIIGLGREENQSAGQEKEKMDMLAKFAKAVQKI
nr:MAG TPA: terminase small subunit [Caudoviricetes sp.]